MDKLKIYFVMPWIMLCLVATVHSVVAIIFYQHVALAWYGALIATAPVLGFFYWVSTANAGRTSKHMPIQLSCAWVGAGLALYDPDAMARIYALGVGFIGLHLYIFWYSPLSRDTGGPLAVGHTLPEFSMPTTGGETISSSDLLGQKSLLMFYRGNWCPLCVAQIEEVALQYRQLADLGVKVVLVSPQASGDTEELAARFNVPMVFAIDEDLALTKQLNLLHVGGKPVGAPGGASDTVMPTIVITDSDNKVIWVDATDNYRVRPEPDVFLDVLKANTAAA